MGGTGAFGSVSSDLHLERTEWQSGHFLHIHGTVLPGGKRKHFCGTVSWEEGFYNLVRKEEIMINET